MKLFVVLLGSFLLAACGPRPDVPIAPALTPITVQPKKPVAVIGPVISGTPPASAVPTIRDEPRALPSPGTPKIDLPALLTNVAGRLQDVYFEYDRFDLSDNSVATLHHNAALLGPLLADFPQVKVSIEGHCDERGSSAYNLALGDQRARRAAEFLERLGLPASSFETLSYGNEMPQCTDPVEACWQRNRRAHFRLRQ